MIWLIQKGFNDYGYYNLIDSLESLGITYHMIESRPFGGGIKELDFPIEVENVMYYGGMSLSRYAKENGFRAHFINDNFDVNVWKTNYGNNLLNYESMTGSFKELNPTLEHFFIRPLEDTKSFSGQLMYKDDYYEWRTKLENFPEDVYRTITIDTLICIAPIQKILVEYRFFVVNDKVVTGSEYKRGNQVNYHSDVGNYVIEFVQQMADMFSPARAYCIDIAELDNGLLKVLELNNINSSGLYACNTNLLVYSLDTMYD